MIQIQGKLDREVYIACSGGVDSMAVVDFLIKNHRVNLMFFDHGTDTSQEALDFLTSRYYPSIQHADMTLNVGNICRTKERSESWEEYWRNERYRWFHSYDVPIITCHHLDDCAETWIFTSLNGEGRIIPYANRNVIRPFRLNRKSEFTNWCRNKNVPWVEDTSNEDTGYTRNFIRHEIMPKALVVNPGLHKVVRKKVLEDGPKTP
jgi:tRNA(Ile)-lysidine synthase